MTTNHQGGTVGQFNITVNMLAYEWKDGGSSLCSAKDIHRWFGPCHSLSAQLTSKDSSYGVK